MGLILDAELSRMEADTMAFNTSYYDHRRTVRRTPIEAGVMAEGVYVNDRIRLPFAELISSLVHETLHNFARVRGRVLGSPLDHRIMHALGETRQPDHNCRVGFVRPSRQCPRPR